MLGKLSQHELGSLHKLLIFVVKTLLRDWFGIDVRERFDKFSSLHDLR